MVSQECLVDAFHRICDEAKQTSGQYLVLAENCPFYGGPEEGGWWGNDHIVISYQRFETEEAVMEAKQKVDRLAKELTEESRRNHNEYCARQMEWLEVRGLDSDFLPEVDGESNFVVYISDTVPESTFDDRYYS